MKSISFPRMHVSLYVSDLNKSIEFYSKFFKVGPSKIKLGYAKFELENPGLIISFIENSERVQSNFGHLGFQVGTLEELESLKAEAELYDLISKSETGTTCCFARQDKFWATDPDGVQWEVYYFYHDTEFNDPHFESDEVENCCAPGQEKTSENHYVEKECCSPETNCCV